MSVTVATAVCGELAVTVAEVDPLTFSAIFAGGQVEKYPAADVTSDALALITVDPGRFAVAVPFGFGPVEVPDPVTGFTLVGFDVLLIVTTDAVTGLNVIVPTFAFGFVHAVVLGLHSVIPPGPVTVVSASSDVGSVLPCEMHAVWFGIVIDVIGGCTYTFTGLLVTAAPVAVICTTPQVVFEHPLNDDSEAPEGGVQIEKSGTPPGLLRFHVPAQTDPVGEMSASCRFELANVYLLTLALPPVQLNACGAPNVPVCPHASDIPVTSGLSVTYTT